jgi:hypothetical protein
MSEAVATHIASQRCQQSRSAESADTLPALYRSEGFYEDLSSEPPPILRLRRAGRATQPVWAGVLASALGLRRG